MISVNFLSKINQKLSRQQKKDKKIFKALLVVFGVVFTAFFLVFASSLYLQYRLKAVKAQIEQVKKQIDAEQQLEANYLFFVNKLIIIRELFDQRADKQIAIGYFSDLLGPNIEISGLNYDMETGILSLTITSPHVFYLEDVFQALDRPEVRENFASFEKSALSRQITGEYSFVLTVGFTEESELIEIGTEYEE
jgi:cell division protein FtsL